MCSACDTYVDRRAMACKPVLNRAAHQFYETILILVLPQLLLELRCEQIEQLGIAGDEWFRGI